MFRGLLGKILPFWGKTVTKTEEEEMQSSGEFEHIQANNDEIPAHEFLNTSNSALSNSALSGDEIQSHEFLDTSEQPSDLDVSLEIQAHPLLTDSGEHVVIPSVYSPRSGSSVDPAEKYSVDSTYTSPVIDPNSPFADLTPRVIIDHDGSGDRSTSNVSDKVVKDKMVLPTIEVTEVGEVEASRDKLTSEDGSAIEAADELKAEKIAEDASKKGEAGNSEKQSIKEETYLDYVQQMSANQKIIKAKDLFYQLGFQKGANKADIEMAAIQQYKLAASRQYKAWIKDARYFAEILFSGSWIDENLPSLDQRSKRKDKGKRKKQKQYNKNEQFETPGGTCRDFRLKENPDIEVVRENAAAATGTSDNKQDDSEPLDKFVSDYTSSVIEQAIKLAISDGLSESVIMDVIEDVTANNSETPRKGPKVTPLDPSRTPRRRPDQLAMGFNYHSDIVVKESPKTLHGEIIPIDLSKQPREKPEQIAVGFNYHSDVIVKNSPKVLNGDSQEDSSPMTPRRRARDQLAVGFSYHAKLLAKDVVDHNENYTKTENKNDNHATENVNGVDDVTPEKTNMEVETVVPKSGKKSLSDTYAVGFSYNSDLMVKEGLDINGHVETEEVDSQDNVEENENINGEVFSCDMVGETRVAGSVW